MIAALLCLGAMRLQDSTPIVLAGIPYDLQSANAKWVLHYTGSDPRVSSKIQDEELSPDRLGDVLLGIIDSVGTAKDAQASGDTSVDPKALQIDSSALIKLEKALPPVLHDGLMARLTKRRAELDDNTSYTTARLTAIDKELDEFKKGYAPAAPVAAADPPATPATSTPAAGTPTVANTAPPSAPPPAPTNAAPLNPAPSNPAPSNPGPSNPGPSNPGPVNAVPAAGTPVPPPIPGSAAPAPTKPVPARLAIRSITLAVMPEAKAPPSGEPEFTALFNALQPAAQGFDPYALNGAIVLEDASGPARADISHAMASLDQIRRPLEPTWKDNVNPFFWLNNVFKSSGDQFYLNLVSHARSGYPFCPCIAFGVDVNEKQSQAGLKNNEAVEQVFRDGNLPVASKALSTAGTLNPHSGLALYNQAIVEAADSNFDQAVMVFTHARSIGLPTDYANAATQYAIELTNLSSLIRADQRGGNFTRVFREMIDAAHVCYNAGMYKEAVSFAGQAAANAPDRPDPYVLAAAVCAANGWGPQAFGWAKLALSHVPANLSETNREDAIVSKLIADLNKIK